MPKDPFSATIGNVVTEPMQTLIDRVAETRVAAGISTGESIVEVNQVVSAAATFYEKVRYLVEYREEHTIRRSAIERILRRHVFIEGGSTDASVLLREMVEGQYLTSEHANESSRERINEIVGRFAELWIATGRDRKVGAKLLSFAASEIDEAFDPWQHAVDDGVVEAMYQTVYGHIVMPGIEPEVLANQLHCACRRVVLNSDDDTLSYALWLLYVPEWKGGVVEVQELARHIPNIMAAIDRDVKLDVQWQIGQRIKNESIYFRIIRELFHQKGAEAERILMQPEQFEAFVRAFLAERYEKENARIRSSGIRAVLYLLISKTAIAFALEVPYEMYMYGALNYITLGVNITFHPLLLLMLTRGVGSLGEANTNAVVSGLKGIVYENRVRQIRVQPEYASFTALFTLLYLVIIAGIFGGIVSVLQSLGFNAASTVLFLFFLALVMYLAFRVRRNAKRWQVSGTEGGFTLFMHVLVAPVVRVGQWLSRTYSSINIFVMIMDFIIEMPFRMLLNFSHHFLIYLKDKADEVY